MGQPKKFGVFLFLGYLTKINYISLKRRDFEIFYFSYFLLKLCHRILKLLIVTTWWLVSQECSAYRGISRTISNIKHGTFAEIVGLCFQLLTILPKKLRLSCLSAFWIVPLYARHSFDTNHQIVLMKSLKILQQSFKRK